MEGSDSRSSPTEPEQATKQPSAHPFLPPRVDENLYQIGVPDMVTLPKGKIL